MAADTTGAGLALDHPAPAAADRGAAGWAVVAVRKWEPGDVAAVKFAWGMGGYRICVRGERHGKPGWIHDRLEGFTADDHPAGPTDARPLVVIDPEDREQVERLARAYCEQFSGRGAPLRPEEAWHMQAALRSLLAPAKPDEPQGLGAVVEDAEGERWHRAREDKPGYLGVVWLNPETYRWARWSEFTRVRVLSEGVTQ